MIDDNTPRWLAWLWVGGAAIAISGSVIGVVVGWMLVGAAGESVEESVTVTRQVLASVGETTRVVDGVFDDVAESLRGVQTTVSETSLTLTRASVVTSNLAEVVSEDVPASIGSVRDALPALIDTARVIDRTMRGLSFFGVDYEPDVPLDESLAEIDSRLADIPTLLTAQQETLDSVAADLGEFASSTVEISDGLAAIRVRLSDASTVLAGYDSIVETSTTVLDRLESDVGRSLDALRLVIVLVGLGVALTQTLPLLVGFQHLRRSSQPS
ncbi:MAG: hypothetical protein R3246_02350 [Acidimicrobiia bacterium]|nr:hypothetical protein [Acidimicrobiia bacterium]